MIENKGVSIIELIKQIFLKENKERTVVIDEKTGQIIFDSDKNKSNQYVN